jgi:hypothetical protein
MRGRGETLEQEGVLEESHGDDGAEEVVVALLEGVHERKKGLGCSSLRATIHRRIVTWTVGTEWAVTPRS